MEKSRGFSLIELAIIFGILGALSIVAFVKYLRIESQARTAKAMAVYGAVREAASLAKAACTLDLEGTNESPTCTPSAGSVSLDGIRVAMLNQYPDATAGGIIAATQFNTQPEEVTITPGNPVVLDIKGGIAPHCRVSYAAATAVGVSPIITLVTTGC